MRLLPPTAPHPIRPRRAPHGTLTRRLVMVGIAFLGLVATSQRTGASQNEVNTTGLIGFSEEVFTLESVGLTLRLPIGARVESQRMGAQITAQILPEASNWLVNIQTHRTKNPQSTVSDALEQTIKAIERSEGTVRIRDPQDAFGQPEVERTNADVLARNDIMRIGDLDAARVYVATPLGNGERLVKGYTIFKPSPTDFVVFELITPEAGLKEARAVSETMIATASFTDPTELMLGRGAAVKSGLALLTQLPPSEIEAIFDGETTWYRVYVPAPGGDPDDARELGYRSVRAWRGQLGEIKPGRSKKAWTREERADGLLVRISGRQLLSDMIVDIDGSFFVRPDRSGEAWSLKTSVRSADGQTVASFTETGFRNDDDLKVTIAESSQPTRTIRPMIQGEGYVSQVEQHMLNRIIGRSGVEADLAFYAYQSRIERIALRRDVVERTPTGARLLRSRYQTDVPERTTLFDGNGEPMRTDLPDGSVSAPTELKTIVRLWRKKGLPTGRLAKR